MTRATWNGQSKIFLLDSGRHRRRWRVARPHKLRTNMTMKGSLWLSLFVVRQKVCRYQGLAILSSVGQPKHARQDTCWAALLRCWLLMMACLRWRGSTLSFGDNGTFRLKPCVLVASTCSYHQRFIRLHCRAYSVDFNWLLQNIFLAEFQISQQVVVSEARSMTVFLTNDGTVQTHSKLHTLTRTWFKCPMKCKLRCRLQFVH